MLSVRALRKSYAGPGRAVEVLRGVDLELAAGETLALTGESGSGKSTLLHILAGLDEADSGDVIVDGDALRGLGDRARARLRRERIGLVFQQFNLVPSLTAGENLAFQARLAGRFDAAWQAELTERLGLAAQLDSYPEALSGGQQQRVAIGRALAARPALLLADEPTGNLDEETSDRVLDLLRALVARSDCALLVVTHSERLAARLDRRAHLTGGVLREPPAARELRA